MVVYEGQPGVECTAKSPEVLVSGMNRFLKHLAITFRRDPNNYRPRINKQDSQKDKEQKSSGNYFFMEDCRVCARRPLSFEMNDRCRLRSVCMGKTK